ncbi:TetR/AcrR family transcriptional regulator [Mucilaginibacter sp. FT3.2]|uniref:TetR/AcrR family transcriptional regulator n=1 Tax=Mucilaginibacter sp. FT3.2 TaxID=2723090 RepID=UPI00160AFF61|nr:TetR/AcrR family transcriptional regulator [Mucilaginibacter sp. FT3.2]MBB6232027.1 AcrR family transcriptional regulator [Mucilaginibacter sp. FT3.2]
MEKELSKAERTRRFILETTAPIFNKKGYAGTSLSDLTEATGLTKGSIYGNFANKEEVAAAAFDYNSGMIRKQIQDRVQKAITYYDKLLVYAQVYHSFTRTATFPAGGCPILNTAVDADDTNPLLKEKAAHAVLRWKKSIENLIQSGIEAGEFRADVDINGTALSMIALIEGGIMIAKVTNTPANLDAVLKTVDALVTALKPVQQ